MRTYMRWQGRAYDMLAKAQSRIRTHADTESTRIVLLTTARGRNRRHRHSLHLLVDTYHLLLCLAVSYACLGRKLGLSMHGSLYGSHNASELGPPWIHAWLPLILDRKSGFYQFLQISINFDDVLSLSAYFRVFASF